MCTRFLSPDNEIFKIFFWTSRNFHLKVDPPFKLSIARARTSVGCSECGKPRAVFCQMKPSSKEVDNFNEMMKDIIWVCGTTLNNEKFVMNENIQCSDPVETCMYSKLIDKYAVDVVCYNCGDMINAKCTEEYINLKSNNYGTLRPTCGLKCCKKNKSAKWINLVPQNSISKFKYEKKMKRKLDTIKLQGKEGRRKRQKVYSEYVE